MSTEDIKEKNKDLEKKENDHLHEKIKNLTTHEFENISDVSLKSISLDDTPQKKSEINIINNGTTEKLPNNDDIIELHTEALKDLDIAEGNNNKISIQKRSQSLNSQESGHFKNGLFLPSNKFSFASIKNWSVSSYKYTKQLLSERLGYGTKTIDVELENKIEKMFNDKNRCSELLTITNNLFTTMQNMMKHEKEFADLICEWGQKSPDIYNELSGSGEMLKIVNKNNSTIKEIYSMFMSNIDTLCNTTMSDTINTLRQYDIKRVEYDSCRVDYEQIKSKPQVDENSLREAENHYSGQSEKFQKINNDLHIKFNLMEENKVKVMKRNMAIFQEALISYYKNNYESLIDISNKFKDQTAVQPETSWLERNE